MFSVYTSLYNLENGLFDWIGALGNFSAFADEVIVATTDDCKDNTVSLLHEYAYKNQKIKIVETSIKFDDYAFDGKLKNEALKRCSKKYCILLDADERIPLSQKDRWIKAAKDMSELDANNKFLFDALMIPSVNLCGSELTYKDISTKWYLHHNHIGLNRGVVNFAKKEDGKIDITKSDTCELLKEDGSLVRRVGVYPATINYIKNAPIPYVLHYWAVDKDKRIGQNKFWKPVWSNRAGQEINTDINLDIIPVFEHNLPLN